MQIFVKMAKAVEIIYALPSAYKYGCISKTKIQLSFRYKGLGFRPLPPEENVESTLIWYRGTDHENYRQWTDALDKFLAGNIQCAKCGYKGIRK